MHPSGRRRPAGGVVGPGSGADLGAGLPGLRRRALPGWMAYQILAGHDPGDEATRVRREAQEAAVAALTEVVGGSRGHRDDFALWGYLGFLDDACLRWVHAGCPNDQPHSLIDAALGRLEGALSDWK